METFLCVPAVLSRPSFTLMLDLFEMPGAEVAGTSVLQPTLERPHLKAHKALPRKRDVILQQGTIPIQSPSSDEDITPDGTPVATAVPTLPLTPPGKTQEEYHSNEPDATKRRPFEPERDIRIVTPPLQLSPPTPDITPPGATSLKQKTGTHPPGQPSMSSRAESFKTAQEAFSSDDEAEALNRPGHSLWSSRQRLSPPNKSPANGLRTRPDASPVTPTPKKQGVVERVASFDSFDGEWIDNREAESATSPSEPKHNPRGCRPNQNDKVVPPVAGGANAKHLEASLAREKSLRERVQESQNAPVSRSAEKFGEDIGWHPTTHNTHLSEQPDSRRLSGSSTTSTVQAMIVDSPPQRRRTLRHMGKKSCLRSACSPTPESNRMSLVSSTESPHRLVHKAARITDQHRWSVTSILSVSTSVASSELQQQPEVIPVVVVPERRSSIKSSSTPVSRNPSVTRSQGSTRRPTTAPDGSTGSWDPPRRKKLTTSDSMSSISGSKATNSRGRGITRPEIPPRSSSLSAPTSRNNSRAASLTAESLERHTLAMELEFEKQHVKQLHPNRTGEDIQPESQHVPGASNQQSAPHGADETHNLRPPSIPFTQSSSPGPVEISEATAVTLFPHKNESVLLIDQHTQPESRAVQTRQTSPTYLGGPDNPRTPEVSSKPDAVDVESQLKNPPSPSKPPAFKIIPPTPMNEVESQLGGQQGDQGEKNREESGTPSRRLGLVRRALSARHRSESAPSLTRSLSTRLARNRKAGNDIDGKLHPFWRPRGFWDEFDNPEGEGSHKPDVVDNGDREDSDMVVGNTLGLPQKRTPLNGPLSLVRRISEPTRRRDRSTLRNRSSQSSLAGRRGRGMSRPRHQSRLHSMPALSLKFRFISLRDLQQRQRDARRRRENEKWERKEREIKAEYWRNNLGGLECREQQ